MLNPRGGQNSAVGTHACTCLQEKARKQREAKAAAEAKKRADAAAAAAAEPKIQEVTPDCRQLINAHSCMHTT